MLLIPVLDLKNGDVVRGVGGNREQYRPIVSGLTPRTSPRDVALALFEAFRPPCVYIADLDAIAGSRPSFELFADLESSGLRLWVDAGVRSADDAAALAGAGVAGVVLGSETLVGPEVLGRVVRELGPERVIVSLDLRAGSLLGSAVRWRLPDAPALARAAVETGVRRLIVLDLAYVGGGKGTGTEALCARLTSAHPGVEIYAGGGIRGMDDVDRLQACGVKGVLVASALHDGRITPEAWLRRPPS